MQEAESAGDVGDVHDDHSEAEGDADGARRVARKVTEYLSREGERPQPGSEGVEALGPIDAVGDGSEQPVGHDDLKALRARALERANALPVPTTRHEEWRFTDLSPLYRLAFGRASGVPVR